MKGAGSDMTIGKAFTTLFVGVALVSVLWAALGLYQTYINLAAHLK